MGIIRAQVNIESVTGLPRDRFVNVLHLTDQGPSPDEATLTSIVNAIATFYRAPWAERLSPVVPDTGHTIKLYDLSHPKPRQPIREASWNTALSVSSRTGPMPSEVAVCLSFYAERNIPRRRGRIFLGPLRTTAVDGSVQEGDARPTTTLVNAIAAAAGVLRTSLNGTWAVYSPTENVARAITDGWVNDSFDIIRKRGRPEMSRALWGG